MNINRCRRIMFSLLTGGLLVVGLLLLLPRELQTARAAPGDLFAAPSGVGDCSQANPCDLQTAMIQATGGDTVFLAQGIYTGTGGAVITVTASITLYGGWDGTTATPVVRDPQAYPTTLSGESARRVVHISGDIHPTIDGLVIVGGVAEDGGGIYVHNASPLVQSNIITANHTIDSGTYVNGRGGGIYVGGISGAVISGNQILSNTSGYGGGIYHYSSAVMTITENEITDNYASHRGGGYMVENAADVLRSNVISGNLTGGDGGGILLWHADAQVEANRVVNNQASVGGGISMANNSNPEVINNWLISNSRDGLSIVSSSPAVINNTIVGSGLIDIRDGIRLYSSSSCSPPYCTTGVYLNNIIVSYETGISGSGPVTPVIDYNNVWANSISDYDLPVSVVTGTHNISLDPLFVNAMVGDYHLQRESPCINAGNPAGVPPAPTTDIDGDSRPFGGRVDIGADEARWLWWVFLPLVTKNWP